MKCFTIKVALHDYNIRIEKQISRFSINKIFIYCRNNCQQPVALNWTCTGKKQHTQGAFIKSHGGRFKISSPNYKYTWNTIPIRIRHSHRAFEPSAQMTQVCSFLLPFSNWKSNDPMIERNFCVKWRFVCVHNSASQKPKVCWWAFGVTFRFRKSFLSHILQTDRSRIAIPCGVVFAILECSLSIIINIIIVHQRWWNRERNRKMRIEVAEDWLWWCNLELDVVYWP